ncbi:sensor histidine kinase-like protein/response regulator Fos-1 [Macroventuria anomochaeta]|uniref:Sensor histidine kinase-like protein/response regulator Fos-1 n=1 Tax=Macroventuria anomochaeta TaxID=301207 RepID=A0ACB6SAI0_9PLEO|nr:sensor histidine kinase-like protein/response regulator Fos-1 [Macroventuria anomochaeta]KAF2630353.1 sensor histidine kinase-like protein/response regulator Fos-1 [Macroventuria anomochaeta]
MEGVVAASLDAILPKPPVSTLVDLPQPKRPDSICDASSAEFDIFRFTPVPTLILDASRRIVQVSDSFVMTSPGGRREDLVGWHADDVLDRTDRTSAFPVLASAREAIRIVEETGSLTQLDHSTDSQQVWRTRTVPIYRNDSLHCTQLEFHDVTEEHRKRLELEERLRNVETFRILVETVKDYAIFMLDPNGNIATWNAGAQAFKGYTKSEIIGQHFSRFYGEDDLATDKPGRELRTALRDGRCEDEGWRYRKDGSRFWANVVITPVFREGVLLGFSKVTRDMTDRRKAEQQLIGAYEEASKLKSEFLANMSHEIRTPMHGLLSALTLLLDTKLDFDQLDLARVIQESGEVLLQVINDILDYSKLANGSFSISHDIINIADIVHSVHRAQQKLFSPQVKFESHLDPQIPKAGEGDSLRYRQIVQNLVSNAAKFTEEGSVQINARLESEDEENSIIRTAVVDTGIGVPEASAKALFTPFTQFDNSATKRYKGTGLGLSICRSLSELMGGEIGFHPNPEGHGSVFWFTIKLKKCKQFQTIKTPRIELDGLRVPSPADVDHMEEIKRVAVNKHLLLAEDNFINRKVMLRMLAGLGFPNIDVATDGKEAVAKTIQSADDRHASVPYDLILMDVNMPVQDGVSATQELRDRGFYMPVIAMTANALKGQAEAYIAKGMSGYIAKPVDRKLLIKILLSCFKDQSND